MPLAFLPCPDIADYAIDSGGVTPFVKAPDYDFALTGLHDESTLIRNQDPESTCDRVRPTEADVFSNSFFVTFAPRGPTAIVVADHAYRKPERVSRNLG